MLTSLVNGTMLIVVTVQRSGKHQLKLCPFPNANDENVLLHPRRICVIDVNGGAVEFYQKLLYSLCGGTHS